jgi:hypothetical protein
MKLILTALIPLVFAFISPTAKANIFGADGNYWIQVCTHEELKETVCPAFIFGLRGAFEMSSDYYKIPKKEHLYCPPDGITLQQSVDIFIKFLKENPKNRHITARVLFIKAMRGSFPCV